MKWGVSALQTMTNDADLEKRGVRRSLPAPDCSHDIEKHVERPKRPKEGHEIRKWFGPGR